MINLNQFNHLVALAEERHFARAAARMHLSQPAFSRSIQTVESKVGLRLFDRERGEVKLTPAGEFIIEKTRRLLFDARCLERDIELYRQGELGDCAFGLGPFPAATMLQEVVVMLRKKHPHVSIRVEIDNWEQLLQSLKKEEIEFFVAATADIKQTTALLISPFMRQRVSLYVRENHPLRGVSTTLGEVWDYGIAATKLTPALKKILFQNFGMTQETEFKLALQCDDIDVLHNTALKTDTVIISTDIAVSKKRHENLLYPLEIKGLPETHVEIGIVSLRNRTHSHMAQEIIRLLKKTASGL